MNIKLFLSYDGTNYWGWQRQNSFKTVQGVIEDSIRDILKQRICLIGSGRTDRGVHAKMQVANFHVKKLPFNVDKLPLILNSKLPSDISCLRAELVDEDFHARFSAKSKTYRYFFYISDRKKPLLDRYALALKSINEELISSACKIFIGTHNFSRFRCINSANKNDVKACNFVRTIFTCKLCSIRFSSVKFIEMTGNGFMYKMVRRIVGALLDLQDGRLRNIDIVKLLNNDDVNIHWSTAPAKGLVLWKVTY